MAKSLKGIKAKASNWLTANSLKIFETRYYDKESGEKTPQDVFRRVSLGNRHYFDLMNAGKFLPNSPTLFNCGLNNGGTLSACFVFDILDALLGDWPDGGKDSPFPDSILGTTFKAASVAKAGGGVGYYFGNIRPEGSEVRSTHKKACGPVAVLRWLNGLNALITQGGKRALAQMGVLNVDHLDIWKFIRCKDDDPQGIGSFNISVSWKDKFLKSVDWDFLEKLKPMDDGFGEGVDDFTAIWWAQARSAWRTGDPGMLFWDVINRANATPHLGDINATNPCGETPNLNNEPCNLGSLAVHRYAVRQLNGKYKMDWSALKHDVRTATAFLDDILDANIFPHPAITKAARDTRKLGLGVMGYADLLALLHIPYDSDEGVAFGEQLMETINSEALAESIVIGKLKGAYPAWNKTKSPKWASKCRNSTRTSIAPTGTISILAGASSSIEPHFALEWDRTTNEGMKLKERIGVYDELNGFVPKVANEIDWRWHVKHQAAFQKHTDLGVSKTINMPNSATVKDMSDAYRMMWETGCKGGTVFRDGCRSEQVLVATPQKTKSVYMTASIEKKDEPPKTATWEINLTTKEVQPADRQITKDEWMTMDDEVMKSWREKRRAAATTMPDTSTSVRHKFKIGGVKGYLHVGLFEDGSPGEIFLRVNRQGSAVQGMMDAWAKAVSKSLQNGVPLADLVKLHAGDRFEPCGLTGNPLIPNCTSIPDYVVRWMEMKFVNVLEVPYRMVNNRPATLPKSDWIGDATDKQRMQEEMNKLKLVEDLRKQNIETAMRADVKTGDLCPDCGQELVQAGGRCMSCVAPGCGYSKC